MAVETKIQKLWTTNQWL